jgi:PAS domain S-box-containing protein
MTDDQIPNSDNTFLDREVFRAHENDEIIDPTVFFALSNDLLVIAGADGFFHRMNQTWEKVTGYTIEELRSKPFIEFVHPEDRERTIETAKRNFAGAEIASFENRYICKDGSVKWFLWNSVLSNNLSFAIAHDITDRKKVEADLLELSLALSNALEGIAQIDSRGEFTTMNKAFASQLGYTGDDLIGVHWQNVVVPSSLERLLAAYDRVKEVGKASFEAQGLRRDGTTFYAEVTVVAILDDKGQFVGHHCFMKDISERKEAEVSLAQSEDRFRNLSAQLPGVVYQFIVHANGTRTFPYISESCKAITGYEPSEIQKDPSLSFRMIHPLDLPGLKAQIEESIRLRTAYSFEGRIVTKYGETKWIQAKCSPENIGTSGLLWNCLLMDINQLKIAEEKIKQLNEDLARRVGRLSDVNHELGLLTRKLELAYDQALEASKLKSEFVANISHEVRTPLSAVIGMADLLLDTKLSEEQQEFTRIVKESAHSLLTIVNDILDFSKMEAGKMELEIVDFDLLALVEGCVELLASSAREKDLQLITYLDPQVPRQMRGDPVRLRQVLLNLTSNAIKFTESGRVVISVEQLNRNGDGVNLRFSVKDTGVGLSAETKNFLFQPFMQADGSSTRKHGGAGLGLSISKRLVELMDGKLGVESEFGHGANFSLTVTLQAKQHSKTFLDTLARSEFAETNVLLIDESGALGHGVQRYLDSAGLTTKLVTNAKKAVVQLKSALLQGHSFNLVVMDYDKRYFEGDRSAFEAIADSARDSHTAIIYLINFDEKEKVARLVKRTHGVSFLIKPIRQLALFQKVNEMLSESTFAADDWDEHVPRVATPAPVPPLQAAAGEAELPAAPAEAQEQNVTKSPAQAEAAPAAPIMPILSPEAIPEREETPPPVDALKAAAKKGGAARVPAGSRRILLAEDNVIMQKLALQQLTRMGFKVTAVNNGQEVLNEIKKNTYAMILMDCQMPLMDGFETTKVIRSEERASGTHIPIVALTASAMQGDEATCYAAGMDDYLCKPVDRQRLSSIIAKWCPVDGKEELDFGRITGGHKSLPTQDSSGSPAAVPPPPAIPAPPAMPATQNQPPPSRITGSGTSALSALMPTAPSSQGLASLFSTPAGTNSASYQAPPPAEPAHTAAPLTSALPVVPPSNERLAIPVPPPPPSPPPGPQPSPARLETGPPAEAVPVMDIEQLTAMYGQDNVTELLQSFISEGETLMANIVKAVQERDVQELKIHAHSLKGMAAVLTAEKMAQASLAIEGAAKTASFSEAEQILAMLQATFVEAKTHIDKALDKKPTVNG